MPGTTDIGNHGDDTVTTVALPFPFTLYDQSFTSINLSSNGNAQFMTTDTTFTNQCLPWLTHNFTIYPYWDDLYLVNSGFGIFTSISGTAPNRIFNIEWRAQYFPGSGSAGFELRLYEGQPRFDVIYGTVTNGNTSATAGVQRDNTFFTQVLLQRLRWCGDWRTKLFLYPGTLPNSYAICHSESNSYIHANAYTNSNSHATATATATPTATHTPTPTPTATHTPTPTPTSHGYCNGNVSRLQQQPRLRLLQRLLEVPHLLQHQRLLLPRLRQLLLLRP